MSHLALATSSFVGEPRTWRAYTMRENLFEIIDYIYDNYRFGSSLKKEEIEKLFSKYSTTEIEKKIVYNELSTLNIEIIGSSGCLKDENSKSDKEISKCEDTKGMRKNKREELELESDSQYFEYLDEFEFGDLDSILEDSRFITEVAKLDDVVNSRYNTEYLMDYQSDENDFQKQRQALCNLVNANQKLVWKVALKYKQFSTVSFDLNDMYQAGMQGLLKAADRFDTSMEYQFSTYATWWIKQSIRRDIADYSTIIRIPVHMHERIVKYVRFENDFWNKNGRIPSNDEVSQGLNILESEVDTLQRYRNIANVGSLNVPVGEDESSFFGDFLPDDKIKSPQEYAEKSELRKEIKDIFNKYLKPKEIMVLAYRFGFADNKVHTLEEIGQVENVTRERIRQIEAKAIEKLKKSKNIERLRDFYYD